MIPIQQLIMRKMHSTSGYICMFFTSCRESSSADQRDLNLLWISEWVVGMVGNIFRNWMDQTADWWTTLIWLQVPALGLFSHPWSQSPIQKTPHAPVSLPLMPLKSTWTRLPQSSHQSRTASDPLRLTSIVSSSASMMINPHNILY